MSSTIYTSDYLAPVISLSDARARLAGESSVGDTLMVRCVLLADDTVYRWVGIHERTTVDECRSVVATVFGIDDRSDRVRAEADAALELGEVLTRPGESTRFTWGLWTFGMQLADVYRRDESTPPSICVAGSGSFGGAAFNIREVNARLLGVERAEGLEELVRADARDVLRRAASHDFVPLIQALGVERALLADAPSNHPSPILQSLPLEEDPRARDAFWSVVLASACCVDEEVTADLTESIMRSLGWGEMNVREIRGLCAVSISQLDALCADLPLPARLDVYRDLLRG
ncbi:hypothetical protein V6D40_09175 [Corynebacterium sp. Q4381]|uniref:hypothetical protein n=1 Tax=Corynebacterium sp. Marseille-Q4381 TaxID=3121597 RepID=UPI002FE53E75